MGTRESGRTKKILIIKFYVIFWIEWFAAAVSNFRYFLFYYGFSVGFL